MLIKKAKKMNPTKRLISFNLKQSNTSFLTAFPCTATSLTRRLSKPKFEIEINEDIFIQLQQIYAENEFDDYKTHEEEVSKVIRCIINFFKDEPHLIII